MTDPRFFRNFLDVLNEGPPAGIGPNAPVKPASQAPLNVPQGWEAKTQPDGSTRISKQGSMSSADYKQSMADYKAKNWTPEKMADYSQRMASGQGYSDAERQANLQQQQQHFGKYADDTNEGKDTVSNPRFFRKYINMIDEGPPPGVGPNAPVRPAAPPAANPNQEPSQFQQAKDAVGQQYQNYKDISGQLDQGVQQGLISKDVANKTRSFVQGSMLRGGIEAGKAALTGRDPSTAYVGSLIKSQGELAANSGLDDAMKKIGPEMNKYRGPNAQDIRNDPAFKKASPEQQAQAIKDYDAIRNISDDDWAHYTSGTAMKQAGQDAIAAGQGMIDQKDWGKGPSAGFSPKTNELFGLDPTRQATDAELKAAATGTNEELDRLKQLIRR